MTRMWTYPAALVALVLALVACRPPKSGETLSESVRAYNEGVRWERFAVAAVHVPPRERSQFLDDSDERAKDVKIFDYEVIKVEQKTDRLADVQIKVSWYRDSEGTLRETQVKQSWERHGKAWLIVDETRSKGVEMPGLREPVAAAVREPPTQDAPQE
jgi:hypothetical protein